MRKAVLLGGLAIMLVVAPATNANLLTNGDWETGDETGWTRTPPTSWGDGSDTWVVGAPGCAPTPANAGHLSCNKGSFGWYQVVPVPASTVVTVEADWMGNSVDWCEVMLWTAASEPSDDDVNNVFGPGPEAAVAYKKDAWGMNPPTTRDWEKASLSPHHNGNGGTIHSLGYVVVGLKLGKSGGGASAAWDNITLLPEPTAALLLGLPMILLRRRRV